LPRSRTAAVADVRESRHGAFCRGAKPVWSRDQGRHRVTV
jgi:hypothetical protein